MDSLPARSRKSVDTRFSVRNLFESLLPLLRPHRMQLLWAVVAIMLDAALTVARPWPLKVVIDRVLSHKPTHLPLVGAWIDSLPLPPRGILLGACAATLIIALLTGALTYAYTNIMGAVGQRVVYRLRSDLFAHMQRLSLRFHDRQRTGDLLTRLTSDINAILDVVASGIIVLISNLCLLVGVTIVMFWINWRFALAAYTVAPLLFWTVVRYTTRIKLAHRAARVSDGLMTSVAQETLSAIRIVQGLGQEEQQDTRFQTQSASSLDKYLESIRYQARAAPPVDFLAAAGSAIVMWYGATQVLSGGLTTGDVVVFFAYMGNLYGPIKALSRLSYGLNKAIVGAERIADVMRVERSGSDRKGGRSCPRLTGSIEFRNVSFEYEPGRPVLSGIDLAIAPGEKVAIVGATGAGKSTLASLVPRLYDVTAGEVMLDGTDSREFTTDSVRAQVSLVLQDALLFSGTIRENIAFGRPDATDDMVLGAARSANAHEFISRLPDGYDSVVAERGVTLSGGQKQRIAIARAILRDAPILILDEPTTGLDAASERKVTNALARAAEGRTTLIIAHRLASIRFADRIVVLERGRIVEQGTRKELLAQDGCFAAYHRYHVGEEEGIATCDMPL